MDLFAALSGAKTALDMLNLAVDARDAKKIASATEALQKRFTETSLMALESVTQATALATTLAALQDEHAKLRSRHAELEQRMRERERYVLTEVDTGVFVYAYQPVEDGANTPPHYLCQACYDDGVKTVLQLVPAKVNAHPHYRCVREASHHVALHSKPPLQYAPLPMAIRRPPGRI
tara:strand:+ start:203 stop:733 length:531 start_codon:yes stop_codon:yes gene_type:complete